MQPAGAAGAARPTGAPQPFDYAWLKGHARALAGARYEPPAGVLPQALAKLDYDHYQAIRFRRERSLWAKDGLKYRIEFFHRGYGYKEAIRMFEVVEGRAREIAYDPNMFDLRQAGVDAGSLARSLGYAGLRVHFHTDWTADVAAFLGASYFRAVGEDTRRYGASARGLAIDTGLDTGEEFPVFKAFWLQRPERSSVRLVVYALLDSPSAAGAYRFEITPGGTLAMDVDAAVYPRVPIRQPGVAPLTSMFLCGRNDNRVAKDWRPEIHDSDGLSILTGAGEWMWRPLVNPAGIHLNSYLDENPRGFGLLQRDRSFDHYQDDSAYYNRRPSVWVEPKGAWGKGAVQLLEMPAPDETYDNVAVFWCPAEKLRPGQEWLYSYRMYWGERMPAAPSAAQVVATRTGIGGVIGRKREYYSWRFAVDFVGGELPTLAKDAKVEPVISASRGTIEITSARPLSEIRGYRAMFDLKPTDDSSEPVDLRLFLRLGDQSLTETWIYQWTPPPVADRKF
jgi:periplasmic glucans biosynthesis protein